MKVRTSGSAPAMARLLVRASGCANTYPATVTKLARDAASYLGLGDVEGDVDGAIEG